MVGKLHLEEEKEFENLKNALLEVEKRHIDFFKSRSSERCGQSNDRLSNHWNYVVVNCGDHFRGSFQIRKDSNLPEDIKAECNEVARALGFLKK